MPVEPTGDLRRSAHASDTSDATGAYTSTPDDPNRTAAHQSGEPIGQAVPGYEMLGELGRGGMGVVYRARQTSLNRIVALKMVLGRGRADRQELIRFLAEAEVAASVAHPNVVRVFDYGESDGRPFMALEFVSGGSLNQKLKAGGPLPPNDAAELVRRIAAGVAAAHDRGIVHRDLKPGNVLLDDAGEPKVADFGLAKRAAGDDLTQTGAVMGTPSYMAPEQAKGESKFVGPQADVWALGVILYECLTGRVPFAGGSSHEVLRRVIEDAPAPPSRSGRIPRDLETICLKCLEKAPGDRYETAAELAADLGRFLAGEPILARPAGQAERAYKWARRKPWQAAALAAGVLVVGLVPFAVVMAALYQQAEVERRNAEAAKANEETERKRAQDAEAGEKVARGAAEKALAGEKVANERLERKNYAATVNAALLDAEAGIFDRARNLLATCPEEHRGWEWHYVHRVCYPARISHRFETGRQANGSVILGLIPDGTTYVVHSVGKKPALYDVATGKLIRETEYAPSKPPTGIFWKPVSLDAQTGQVVIDPKPRDRFKASSQGGQRTVTAYKGDTLQVTDRASKAARLIPGNVGGITAVAISQDGKTAAVSCGDTAVRVWDLDTRRSIAVLRGYAKPPLYVGLSPDGRTVVTASTDGTSHVWDVATTVGPRAIAGQMYEYRPGVAPIPSATGSPALRGGRTWLADNLRPNEVVRLPGLWQYHLLALPVSGGRVLTTTYPLPDDPDGSDDVLPFPASQIQVGTKAWDAATGQQVHAFSDPEPDRRWARCNGMVTADGKQLVVVDAFVVRKISSGAKPAYVSDPSTVQVVDLTTWAKREVVRLPAQGWRLCGLSRDGRRAVIFSNTGEVLKPGEMKNTPTFLVVDLTSGATVQTISPKSNLMYTAGYQGAVGAALSDDGTLVAVGLSDGTISLREVATNHERFVLRGHVTNFTQAAFAPGSGVLATAGVDGKLMLWHVGTGGLLHQCLPPAEVTALSFSGDGKRLLTGDHSGRVVIWDPETGDSLLTLNPDFGPIRSIAWVPGTNRILATAGSIVQYSEAVGLLWDAAPINQSVKPLPPLHQAPTSSGL